MGRGLRMIVLVCCALALLDFDLAAGSNHDRQRAGGTAERWSARQADNCEQLAGAVVNDVKIPCEFSVMLGGPKTKPWGGRGWKGGWLGYSEMIGMKQKPQIATFQQLLAPGMRYNSPIISSSGKIFIVTQTGLLYSLKSFGDIDWLLVLSARVEATPTLHGNTLVIPTSKGVVGYDARDGILANARKLWEVPITGGVYSSPTTDEGIDGTTLIYVSADNQRVYCIEAKGYCNALVHSNCLAMQAKVLWSTQVGVNHPNSISSYQNFDARCSAPNSLPMSANIDCVQCNAIIDCATSCVFCEDQTISGISPLRATPALSQRLGLLFVSAWDGLHTLVAATGEELVSKHFFKVLQSDVEEVERFQKGVARKRMRLLGVSPLIVPLRRGEVVVFASGANLYAVDAATGSEVWHLQNIQDFVSSPSFRNASLPGAAEGEGDVIVGTRDGVIMAVRARDGATRWAQQVMQVSDALAGISPSLAPVVDAQGWVYALSASGMVGMNGGNGELSWTEPSCTGSTVMGSVVLTDDGQMVAVCDDSHIRAYCCAPCVASQAAPSGGLRAQGGQNVSFEVSLRNVQMWDALEAYPVCVIDGVTRNGTRVTQQIASCTAPIIGGEESPVAGVTSFALREGERGMAFYDECPLQRGSVFGDSVKCGFANPAKALTAVCVDWIKDNRSFFKLDRDQGGGACVLEMNVSVGVKYAARQKQRPASSCPANPYVYSFPTVLDTASPGPIPIRKPPDYTSIITVVVVSVTGCMLVMITVIVYERERKKAAERKEDAMMDAMLEYISSSDLDPAIKYILQKARMRIRYGQVLERVWTGWTTVAANSKTRRTFESLLTVQSLSMYETLRGMHPALGDGDLLCQYAAAEVEEGLEAWSKAKQVLNKILEYSPEWCDAWTAYLDGEIRIYNRDSRERSRLYAEAKYNTLWTDSHDRSGAVETTLWGDRHVHSVDLELGRSKHGPSATKMSEKPQLSCAIAEEWALDDGVVAESDAVFFGGGGDVGTTCAFGVSERGVSLSAASLRLLLGSKTWAFVSQVSRNVSLPILASLEVRFRSIHVLSWASLTQPSGQYALMKLAQQRVRSILGTGAFHDEATLFVVDMADVLTVEIWRRSNAKVNVKNHNFSGAGGKDVLVSRGRVPVSHLFCTTRHQNIPLQYSVAGRAIVGADVVVEVRPSVPLGGERSRDLLSFDTESRIAFALAATRDDETLAVSERLAESLSTLGWPEELINTVLFKANPWCSGMIQREHFIPYMSQALFSIDQDLQASKVRRRIEKDAQDQNPSGPPQQGKPQASLEPGPGPASEAAQDTEPSSEASVAHRALTALMTCSPMFHALGVAASKKLVSSLASSQDSSLQCAKDEVVQKEGEQVASLLVVLSGRVSVMKEGKHIFDAGVGSVLLEQPLLSKTPSPFSIVIATPGTSIAKLHHSIIHQHLRMTRLDFAGSGNQNNEQRSCKIADKGKLTTLTAVNGLVSGDRVKIRLDRSSEQLILMKNGQCLGDPLRHVAADVFPYFVLNGIHSSWSLVASGYEEDLVQIGVVGADNLPFGMCNSFCSMEYRSGATSSYSSPGKADMLSFKTKTIHNDFNPEWRQAFVVPRRSGSDDRLRFQLWNSDFVGGHRVIGGCDLNLSSVSKSDETERIMPITLQKGRGQGGPCVLRVRIELSRSWSTEDEKAAQREAAERGSEKAWSHLQAAAKATAALTNFGHDKTNPRSDRGGKGRIGVETQFRLWKSDDESEDQPAVESSKGFAGEGSEEQGSSMPAGRSPGDVGWDSAVQRVSSLRHGPGEGHARVPYVRRKGIASSEDGGRAGLAGLPGSIVPDLQVPCEAFYRVFGARLTPPQQRFFYLQWVDFEESVRRSKTRRHALHLPEIMALVEQRSQHLSPLALSRFEEVVNKQTPYNKVEQSYQHGRLSITVNARNHQAPKAR